MPKVISVYFKACLVLAVILAFTLPLQVLFLLYALIISVLLITLVIFLNAVASCCYFQASLLLIAMLPEAGLVLLATEQLC